MTNVQNPYTTLLQPTDLTFYTRVLSGIDVSAFNINSFVVGIEKDTFDSNPDESNILVATEYNNDMSWLAATTTTDLQLVPLENLARRRVVVPEERMSVTTPVSFVNEPSTVAATWQWLLSLFAMVFITPALVNTFVFAVLYVGWYYYSYVFEMVYTNPLTFADRTAFAGVSLAAVYSAYVFLDNMLIVYVERFSTAVYASFPATEEQQYSQWNILNTSWNDLKYRIYSWVVRSLTPSVVVGRFAWFMHTAFRMLGKGVFYAAIVFYVTALLWSLAGVPYTALVSRNSPVYGYAVSGMQQLGLVLPASFASQLWYQQMAGDVYHIGGVANAQPATGYYNGNGQQQAFNEMFQ